MDILARSVGVPLDVSPVSRMVNKPSMDGKELIRPIEEPVFLLRPFSLLVTLELIQQAFESFHLFWLLQDDGHEHRLKPPRSPTLNLCLHLPFRTRNHPIKRLLILLRKRLPKGTHLRRPCSMIWLNEGSVVTMGWTSALEVLEAFY